MAEDVIPKSDPGKLAWAANLQVKFPLIAPSLGFAPADITAAMNDLAMLVYLIEAQFAITAEKKERTEYKTTMFKGVAAGGSIPPLPVVSLPSPPAVIVAPGIIPRLRLLIKRIKVASGYSNSIGLDLGIVPSAPAPPAVPKPKFTLKANVGSIVVIDWTKGKFDGVWIESQRGSETAWVQLDKDFKSPFADERPPLFAGQPEQRRYRMIYLQNDQIVGVYSDISVVITQP